MTFKVFDILFGKTSAVHGFNLVFHDIAVLLDVVLLVELLTQSHDILPGYIGIGIELRAGSGIRSLDIVADEIALFAKVETCIEFLDIGEGDFLVYGHQ